MTVDVNDRLSGPHLGNGVTTAFEYDWYILANTDLRVILRDEDGNDDILSVGYDYTVSGVGVDGGGDVNFIVAPPSGTKVIIEGNTPKSQTVNYVENDRFPYASHQAGMDKLERQIQEVQRDADRAIKYGHGEPVFRLPLKPDETKLLVHTVSGAVEHGELVDISPGSVIFGTGWLDALAQPIPDGLSDYVIKYVTTYAALTALTASTGLQDGGVYGTVSRSNIAELNDGSSGVWRFDAASTATANGGTILAINGGGAGRFFRLYSGRINVKWFGAKGDGTTDDSAAIQAAFDLAAAIGGIVYLPHGRYLINSTITLDNSGQSSNSSSIGVGLEGDGPNNTVIINGSDSTGLLVRSSFAALNASISRIVLRGFRITKTGSGTNDIGLYLDTLALFSIYDVYCASNTIGMRADDLVAGAFYNCRWEFNTYGSDFRGETAGNGGTISSANAITFSNCWWYGNANFSGYFKRACNVNFIGGGCENTLGGAMAQRYAFKFEEPGQYGVAAVLFSGMYFEKNDDVADVWFVCGSYPITATFIANSFNRIDSTVKTTNNIRIDTNSDINIRHKVVGYGNGFRGLGTYAADSGRKYIVSTGTTPIDWDFDRSKNYFNSETERPLIPSYGLYSQGIFQNLSTTPTLYRGVNVASVARNSTGSYTITHIDPSYDGFKNYHISSNLQGGQCRVTAADTTTTTVEVRDNTGTLADPSVLNVSLWE